MTIEELKELFELGPVDIQLRVTTEGSRVVHVARVFNVPPEVELKDGEQLYLTVSEGPLLP